MKTKKIYCLNTILERDGGYESEDLEAWFSKKPTTKNLMDYFQIEANDQKSINKITKLLAGEPVRIYILMYRLDPMDEYTFKE